MEKVASCVNYISSFLFVNENKRLDRYTRSFSFTRINLYLSKCVASVSTCSAFIDALPVASQNYFTERCTDAAGPVLGIHAI